MSSLHIVDLDMSHSRPASPSVLAMSGDQLAPHLSAVDGTAGSLVDGVVDGVERVSAHVVLIAVSGEGDHMIDFVTHRIRPKTALHIQPGQIHRWSRTSGLRASVAFIEPRVVPAGLFDAAILCPEVDLTDSHDIVRALMSDLVRQSSDHGEPGVASQRLAEASAGLLLHHLSAASTRGTPETAQEELLRVFHTELERSYMAHRSVAHYARIIGTSAKTLSRVTAALVDASPKELIDRRVMLEARRLLVATTLSAASIGSALGFSEPTNFTKFFARHNGVSPQEFRVGF